MTDLKKTKCEDGQHEWIQAEPNDEGIRYECKHCKCLKIACQVCGNTFTVTELFGFKYSHHCDRCLMRAQPYIAVNPMHVREDTIIDEIEADEEFFNRV